MFYPHNMSTNILLTLWWWLPSLPDLDPLDFNLNTDFLWFHCSVFL